MPPKLLACEGFLHKVVHAVGRLGKFDLTREIEFNFLTAWNFTMKLGPLVHHAHGHKKMPRIYNFSHGLSYSLSM